MMSVCYLDSNYYTPYKCEYSEDKGCMEVSVEYNIENEIEIDLKNVFKMFSIIDLINSYNLKAT